MRLKIKTTDSARSEKGFTRPGRDNCSARHHACRLDGHAKAGRKSEIRLGKTRVETPVETQVEILSLLKASPGLVERIGVVATPKTTPIKILALLKEKPEIERSMLTILRPTGQATGQADGQATGQANRTNKIQLGDRLGNPSVETSVETSVEILNVVAVNPKMTLAQIASKVGRTPRAIEMAVAKLQKEGKLRRVGPQKGGRWEVLK